MSVIDVGSVSIYVRMRLCIVFYCSLELFVVIVFVMFDDSMWVVDMGSLYMLVVLIVSIVMSLVDVFCL